MLRYRPGRCVVARVLLRETKFYAVGVIRPGLYASVAVDHFFRSFKTTLALRLGVRVEH